MPEPSASSSGGAAAGREKCGAASGAPCLNSPCAPPGRAARLMPSDEEKGNRAMPTHTATALVPPARYDVIPVSRGAR